jgi:hypothetical protein
VSHFNEIQVPRFNLALAKLLNMKEGAPAPTLASDVSPGICLENDRFEWLFLGGQLPLIGNLQSVATAAVNSRVRIRCIMPNVLLVVEKMIVSVTGATDVVLFRHPATQSDLAGSAGSFWPRDCRQDPAAANVSYAGICTISEEHSTTNSNGSRAASFRSAGAATFEFNDPWILWTPKAAQTPILEWRSTVVNIGVEVTFVVRVRGAEPPEER